MLSTPLSYALPQALNTRTLNLGSTAFAGSGGLTGADVAPLLGAALVLTATAIGLTTVAMRVIKLR